MAEARKFLTIPEAGREYFGAGRNKSYELAKTGFLPTIQVGSRFVCPVVALEKKLANVDGASDES